MPGLHWHMVSVVVVQEAVLISSVDGKSGLKKRLNGLKLVNIITVIEILPSE